MIKLFIRPWNIMRNYICETTAYFVPEKAGLISENLRDWNKGAWRSQLGPLMKEVPGFEEVWQEWVTTFHRIFGENNSM